MENNKAVVWLKLAFLVGMITDALALLPMLFPPLAKIFWGFSDLNGIYYFAMGFGASVMLAWTILLYWAYRKPLERRFIAPLTGLIIIGFVITEIVIARNNYIQWNKVIPSFLLQTVLLILFAYSFIISGKRKTTDK